MGLELIRLNKPPHQSTDSIQNKSTDVLPRTFHRPLYIEFIGASGVGKTTLYKALEENKTTDDHWIERKQYLKRHKSTEENKNRIYQYLAERKFEKIMARDYPLSDKLDVLSFFFRNLNEEIRTFSQNEHYTIICEDGLFHNFGDCIAELYHENSKQFNELIKDRAIIFCNSNLENSVLQIQKRQSESGEIRPQHKDVELNILTEKQKVTLESKVKFAELLRNSGVPVLEINTADTLPANAQKVHEFIRQLQQRLNSDSNN